MQVKISDTKTDRVKRELLKMLIEKKYSPHEMLPSEGMIAELFGVSRMTSKLALNALAEEGIIYRVPRKGSFLKDIDMTIINSLLGESAVKEEGGMQFIALVLPGIDLYTGQIITELSQVAGKDGYEIIIKVSEGIPEREEKILQEIAAIPDIKGVVFFPGDKNVCGNELLYYKLRGYPIVMVDRVYKEIEFDSVYHDHYQGARKMVNHLISKGHKKIGFISCDVLEVSSRNERYKGYVDAMSENKLNIENDYVMTKNSRAADINFVDYLKKNTELTAVFCGDDYLAIRLYSAAKELGITIPDRLSVAGFTDNAILEYSEIELTTMRQPVRPLMEEAFNIITEKIRMSGEPVKHIKIPTELIERKSVRDLRERKTDEKRP
ncbi:GntR family transcriptional regulator [Anaerocolumna xylanovorans]|uniref:DNA-binding transcriptional regulator, LacI/PurR family n=1 Tax=Anaerocolumna xylanovorans DSM 12503 TaxID=1121345 RepID=A0A1M7Y5D1_9FIRM|nr:GntR family transcriptional regulator [Anaerocolumna xylanovorans]SHO47581.1 DNA-binding transcriptional regulator, LacI/PurR family [Anaerocolumna xylanovorans DSM 12503]